MRQYKWSLLKTLDYLNSRRSDLEIRATFFEQLKELEETLITSGLGAISSDWKAASPSIPGVTGSSSGSSDHRLRQIENSPEEILLRNTYLNSKQGEIPDYYIAMTKQISNSKYHGYISPQMARSKPTKIVWSDEAGNNKKKLVQILNQANAAAKKGTPVALRKPSPAPGKRTQITTLQKPIGTAAQARTEEQQQYYESILKGSKKTFVKATGEEVKEEQLTISQNQITDSDSRPSSKLARHVRKESTQSQTASESEAHPVVKRTVAAVAAGPQVLASSQHPFDEDRFQSRDQRTASSAEYATNPQTPNTQYSHLHKQQQHQQQASVPLAVKSPPLSTSLSPFLGNRQQLSQQALQPQMIPPSRKPLDHQQVGSNSINGNIINLTVNNYMNTQMNGTGSNGHPIQSFQISNINQELHQLPPQPQLLGFASPLDINFKADTQSQSSSVQSQSQLQSQQQLLVKDKMASKLKVQQQLASDSKILSLQVKNNNVSTNNYDSRAITPNTFDRSPQQVHAGITETTANNLSRLSGTYKPSESEKKKATQWQHAGISNNTLQQQQQQYQQSASQIAVGPPRTAQNVVHQQSTSQVIGNQQTLQKMLSKGNTYHHQEILYQKVAAKSLNQSRLKQDILFATNQHTNPKDLTAFSFVKPDVTDSRLGKNSSSRAKQSSLQTSNISSSSLSSHQNSMLNSSHAQNQTLTTTNTTASAAAAAANLSSYKYNAKINQTDLSDKHQYTTNTHLNLHGATGAGLVGRPTFNGFTAMSNNFLMGLNSIHNQSSNGAKIDESLQGENPRSVTSTKQRPSSTGGGLRTFSPGMKGPKPANSSSSNVRSQLIVTSQQQINGQKKVAMRYPSPVINSAGSHTSATSVTAAINGVNSSISNIQALQQMFATAKTKRK